MSSPPDPAQHIVELADQCVKCGLCLPHCPTYAASRSEGESPRGRIALAQGLAEGRLAFSGPALEHIDSCLSCRACERVCPPGVRYGVLLQTTRSLITERRGLPILLRRLRWLLRRPRRLDLGLSLLRLLRRTGLGRISERLGLSPGPDVLPTPPARTTPVGGGSGREVVLFLGCVARRYDAEVHAAAVRLLKACGYRVSIPDDQGCCGALFAHAGDLDAATKFGGRLATSLAGDAPVLVSASGCFEGVRQALGPRVRDIHAFLAADSAFQALQFQPLDASLALHLPCTLRNVSGGADAVVDLLARIPSLRLARLPEQGRCCGAAGIQFLQQPRQARALRETVLADLRESAADSLCSANIGCRLWLQAGLSIASSLPPVYHPLQLLARQLDAP